MDAAAKFEQSSVSALNPILARLIDRNQLVIPMAVTVEFPGIETFAVSIQEGRIVLTPLNVPSADTVRLKPEARGITEADVAEVVEWARGRQS